MGDSNHLILLILTGSERIALFEAAKYQGTLIVLEIVHHIQNNN
jgi:hypothetical protein